MLNWKVSRTSSKTSSETPFRTPELEPKSFPQRSAIGWRFRQIQFVVQIQTKKVRKRLRSRMVCVQGITGPYPAITAECFWAELRDQNIINDWALWWKFRRTFTTHKVQIWSSESEMDPQKRFLHVHHRLLSEQDGHNSDYTKCT